MHKILIKQPETETYELIDGVMEPQHEAAELEAPCCSGTDSEGNQSCGCRGQYSVTCPAVDCPGIADYQVDALIDLLMPEPDYE